MRNIKYSEALSEGLVQAMERDPGIFVTGIAVDYPSGIFGSTTEALRRFGPKRVFDSPAMENALTGIAIGAAALKHRGHCRLAGALREFGGNGTGEKRNVGVEFGV